MLKDYIKARYYVTRLYFKLYNYIIKLPIYANNLYNIYF